VELLESRELLSTYSVDRPPNPGPLISSSMFDSLNAAKEGENINGPSVIRVPSWIDASERPHPSAQYYMYFAHHKGNYIRMAWAEDVLGPWNLFNVGDGNNESVGRGVLDLDIGPPREVAIGNGITIRKHIASPDVVIDDANQQIVMYFHGPTLVNGASPNSGREKTFVATSADGLNFNLPSEGGQSGHGIRPVILGNYYFRVFQHGAQLYAVSRSGKIYQAPNPADPWTPPSGFNFADELWTTPPKGQNPFQRDLSNAGLKKHDIRHVAVRTVDDTLEVFYSRIGDAPERILYSTIDLSAGGPADWDATFPPEEILRPQERWEGAKDPNKPSRKGSAPEAVNQLRDPYLFQDDDRLYLFYSGRGEDAIGVVELIATG
jgi:hypothetical protein